MSCREIRRFTAGKRVSGKWVKQRERKAFKITELKETSKEELKKGGCVL